MGDPNDPAVLLIMGLGAQLLLWRKGFCEKLVDQGLRVIRYDNRDVGLSTKLTGRHSGAPAAAADGAVVPRPAQPGGLHARGHGRRRRRAARPPGHRPRAHRRRLDGRHDRAGLRRPARRTHQDARRHLLQQQPAAAAAAGTASSCWPSLQRPEDTTREAIIDNAVRVARIIGSPGYPAPEDRVRADAIEGYDRSYYPRRHRPPFRARSWAAAACCATTGRSPRRPS